MELPNAPTQEHAEEPQVRTLLWNDVVPEGNQTVSWIWRGSLSTDPEDRSDEYGEGLWLCLDCAQHELMPETRVLT